MILEVGFMIWDLAISTTIHNDLGIRMVNIEQWESVRPNLDLPNIEARSEVSA